MSRTRQRKSPNKIKSIIVQVIKPLVLSVHCFVKTLFRQMVVDVYSPGFPRIHFPHFHFFFMSFILDDAIGILDSSFHLIAFLRSCVVTFRIVKLLYFLFPHKKLTTFYSSFILLSRVFTFSSGIF